MNNDKPIPCPICGNPLTVMAYGWIPMETWEELKKGPVKYIDGGCTIQRHHYVCTECDLNFTGDLQPLKPCMLAGEYDDQVTEDECKNYDYLKNEMHYVIPENKAFICNVICPFRDKKVRIRKKDGSIWEGYYYSYSLENNKLEVTKDRNRGFNAETETFAFSEIENISEAEPDPDYEYTLLEDGTAEIKKYYGKEKTIAVPETIDGRPVSSIGKYAFSLCKKITSVILPDSVTNIGDGAFNSCENLISVTIPDGVKSIGEQAFHACESLASVSLPESVETIGDGAFRFCESLFSINIPNSVKKMGENPLSKCNNLSSVNIDPNHPILAITNGFLYSRKDKKLICCFHQSTETPCVIPRGIQIIGSSSLPDGITTVIIPDTVIGIEDSAFFSCTTMTSIIIPDSVTTIGSYAFSHCEALTSISIPNSVTTIGRRAFWRCDHLTVTVPGEDSYTAQYCRENNIRYSNNGPEEHNMRIEMGRKLQD